MPITTVISLVRVRGHVFLTLLIATVVCVSGFWFAIPPTYLTNDDVAIRRAIEGLTAPGAAPTGYVIMAHSLLGWILASTAPLTRLHGWDLAVASVLICSIASIVTIAWCLFDGVLARTLSVVVALAIMMPLLAGMQFTISATLAGIAAMSAIVTELFTPVPRKSMLLASAVLLVVGLLVRPLGAAAGGLLSAALLSPLAIAARNSTPNRFRRLFLAVAALGVLAGSLVYVDRALYRLAPEWSTYREDHWRLAWAFEWGGGAPETELAVLRSRVGWSQNDWDLVRQSWGIDPVIHSHERLDVLYRSWSAMQDWREQAASVRQRVAAELTESTSFRLLAESRLALGLCALVALAFASRRGLIAVLGSATIFYAAGLAIEIAFKELPVRLFAPLQVGLVVAVLVTCRVLGRPTHALVVTLCMAAAGGLLAYQAETVVAAALADQQQSKETDTQVRELLGQHPSLLLLHSDAFPSEHWWRPFHTPPVKLPSIQLGLNNHNPYVLRFIARTYGESLLYASCTHPSILVVAEPDRLEPVTLFMHEHYDMNVSWDLAYEGSFRAWRCSPAKTYSSR